MAWHALAKQLTITDAACADFENLAACACVILCHPKAGALQQQSQLIPLASLPRKRTLGLVSVNVVELSFLYSMSICDPHSRLHLAM